MPILFSKKNEEMVEKKALSLIIGFENLEERRKSLCKLHLT